MLKQTWCVGCWCAECWRVECWRVESWRVESTRPAPCLRDQGSRPSRQAAARRCRGQAGHRLRSRCVVRPLPAPMPWALLRPPPFVRAGPPSDSCHTLVTEMVPDYPLLIASLQRTLCKSLPAKHNDKLIVTRTVDFACIDAIVLPGDFSLGGGSCLIRGTKQIQGATKKNQSAIRRGAESDRRLSGARLLLLASRVR